MYNASDDWDKDPAERKFDQRAGQPVKFVWYSDYGFDGTLKITSASGGDVPYEYVTTTRTSHVLALHHAGGADNHRDRGHGEDDVRRSCLRGLL